MENKSLVKLTKYEYNERYHNIVIKNTTSVTHHTHPLNFDHAESLTTPEVTISNVKTTSPHQLVSLNATVKYLSGTKAVKTYKDSLKKCSCILQDPTGTIEAVFWEEWIGSVENEKTYKFTNFRVKKNNYTDEIYVNTAKDGFEVKECEQPFTQVFPDAQPTISHMATKQVTISIGVKSLSKYNTCSACRKKVQGCGRIIKCDSRKLKQKASPENINWYARLFLRNKDTKEKFYLSTFNAQLTKLLQVNDNKLTTDHKEESITDILLDIVDIEITYNIADGKLIDVISN